MNLCHAAIMSKANVAMFQQDRTGQDRTGMYGHKLSHYCYYPCAVVGDTKRRRCVPEDKQRKQLVHLATQRTIGIHYCIIHPTKQRTHYTQQSNGHTLLHRTPNKATDTLYCIVHPTKQRTHSTASYTQQSNGHTLLHRTPNKATDTLYCIVHPTKQRTHSTASYTQQSNGHTLLHRTPNKANLCTVSNQKKYRKKQTVLRTKVQHSGSYSYNIIQCI